MTLHVDDKEAQAVLSLEGPKRYSYWIKRVTDQEEVWSLWMKGGWVLASDDKEGRELVPVWSHPRFASVCAVGVWEGSEPKMITFSAWMRSWLPGCVRDRRFVAAFPTPANQGIIVSPMRLKEDLEKEAPLYE